MLELDDEKVLVMVEAEVVSVAFFLSDSLPFVGPHHLTLFVCEYRLIDHVILIDLAEDVVTM